MCCVGTMQDAHGSDRDVQGKKSQRPLVFKLHLVKCFDMRVYDFNDIYLIMWKNNTLPVGMCKSQVKRQMRSIKCADERDLRGRRRVRVTCSYDDIIEERSMLSPMLRSDFSARPELARIGSVTEVRQQDHECEGVLSIRYWHSAANGFR